MGRLIEIITGKGFRPYPRAVMTKYMKGKYGEQGKLRWQDPAYQKKMKQALSQKPNKLEIDFYFELVHHIPNLVFVGNQCFFVKEKNPDFILDEGDKTSKCIDLFGDHWHKGENANGRIEYFKNEGYDLLVIWESEWKNDKSGVVEKVIHWAA